MDAGLPRGTVTFLFTDIEGSTELSRLQGAAYGDLRDAHRRVLREVFGVHSGHEIDAEGDAFFIAFERACDAVAAAVAGQRALLGMGGLRVRMGLHTTDPHVHSGGYVGVGVSRAARICAAGHGGQIVLSQATAGVVEDAQLADVQLRDLGDHYLKDIELPQRLFQVEADGLPSQFPRLGARNTAGTVGTLVAIDLSGWRHVLRKLGDDGAATAAAAFHKIVTDATRAADGVAVELVGDWSLCLFPVPKSALVATTAIKRELETSGWIEGVEKPLLKAAVHTGRVTGRRGQPLGSAALRVSLMCGGAQPGQILVSHSTHAVLEGEVLPDFTLTDLGEREYGDTGPTRTYELTLVDSPS